MKHIIYFTIGFLMLFMYSAYAHAEGYPEDNPADESIFQDDDNDYSSGGFCSYFVREKRNNDVVNRHFYKDSFECTDGYYLFWIRSLKRWDLEDRYQLVCRKTEMTKSDLVSIENESGGVITVTRSSTWFFDTLKNEKFNYHEGSGSTFGKGTTYNMVHSRSDTSWLGYRTNIPIFDYDSDTFLEDVNKYINSGGTDYSGSANSVFIDRSNSSVDNSVDFPHEFQTSQCVINWTGTIFEFKGRDSINASWKVPDDKTYDYQIQMKAMIKFPKNDGKIHIGKNGFEDKWTDWHDVEIGDYSVSSNGRKVCYINPSLMLKLFNDDIHSVKYGSPDLMGVAYDIKEVQFRVRHLKGNKCSNWVSSYIESSGSSNTYLEDDDGNYVDNTEYQGQQTSTDYNSGEFKTNDIISFIKSGFGLSGSNGLIAMFKQFFNYLPPAVNVILLTGVAIMVFVAVVKWITTIV